jgi:ribosomal subunit interface protein
MTTSITARHCEISEELRLRAEAVLTRLGALIVAPVDGTVVFDVAPAASTAEIRLRGGRGESFNATGEDKDHRSALDRAEEKIRRQLDKPAQARRGRGAKDVA